ncbi:phosphatase PAP2 family protein [Vibrio breoganii]
MILEPIGRKISLLSGKVRQVDCALLKVIFINTCFLIAIDLIFKNYTEQISIDYYLYLSALVNGLVVSLVVYFSYLFIICAIKKEPNPLKYIAYRYKDLLTLHRFIPACTFLCLFLLTSGLYTSLKVSIPIINSFSWDVAFTELDRYLHFGYDPWVLTHKLASSPYATLVINILYNLWFFVFWTFLVLLSFSESSTKYHAILTFNLCWLVNGILFAILFSSAGPCFFLNLPDGDGTFTPLIDILSKQDEYLHSKGIEFGVAALKVQDYIWNNYERGTMEIGAGISAFPSMHVSIATLMAITCYEVNKKLGLLAWLYTFIILFGSVHLGWHYAVDGYFSLVSTVLIWIIVKSIIKKAN